MEVVDELLTPGCPNCYIKHMSAALSYLADCHGKVDDVYQHQILLARAVINFAEAAVGYKSHYDFAVGLLERAELEALTAGYTDIVEMIRNERLFAIQNRDDISTVICFVRSLNVTNAAFYWAHIIEANRELKTDNVITSAEDITRAIESVMKEFFIVPDILEKGGEGTMACAKKAVAKKAADKKAAKAACKGGKCGKKSCK